MPTVVEMTCQNCKQKFYPRLADVNRGWGRFCSKQCKAIKQEAKTGQYKKMLQNNTDEYNETDVEAGYYDSEDSF